MENSGRSTIKAGISDPSPPVKYTLLEQVGITTGFIAIGTAVGALSWFLMWLYMPDREADPGRLSAIGTGIGTLPAISFVVWANVDRTWAIVVTIALLAVVAAGVWFRVVHHYNRRHAR